MGKILITGGSGFIGTHLVSALLQRGDNVINLDTIEPKLKEHRQYWKNVDICNAPALTDAIESFQPDTVIHLAARTDLRGKSLAEYKSNTLGVENLLNALEKCSPSIRVIFTSSMYVCRPGKKPLTDDDYDPHTIYGESKVQTEKIIRQRQPAYTYCIIRPTSIWGPHFGEPYKLFFSMVLGKKYFHLGKKACRKTYGYVENTIAQVFQLLEANDELINGKVFYLGDYEPYDITEWANEIGTIAGIKIPTIPFAVFRIAAYFGDALKTIGITFPMTSFRLSNMTTDNIYDLTPIRSIAPQLPVNRSEGTRRTVRWMKTGETEPRPVKVAAAVH